METTIVNIIYNYFYYFEVLTYLYKKEENGRNHKTQTKSKF